jgi:lamin tail-like protein/type IX secretion system substrate protein
MASNSLTVSDQNAEYDDWVELYNNTSSTVNLENYYLSDDISEPYKWQLPDTSIAANGYLIIWTDNDTLQSGLHANFKLSASGEAVIFSDASKNMMGYVSFSAQTSDITTGRYPNGTGSFIEMTPTYAAENINTLDIHENESFIPEVWIYPNPAKNIVNISINDNEEHLLSIYNISGQLINQEYVVGKKTIDISYLNPGFYLLNVDGTISKKLIKQ